MAPTAHTADFDGFADVQASVTNHYAETQATQHVAGEEYSAPFTPQESQAAKFGKLTPLGELAKMQQPVELSRAECTIGRGSACDVKIVDLTVSSQHCKVVFDSATGVPYVVDYSSSNGTFVNRRSTRLAQGKIFYLVSGDHISLVGAHGKGAAPPLFSETKQTSSAGFEFVFSSTDPTLVPDAAAAGLAGRVPGMDEKYAFVKELGKGNFATVYRAVSRATGEQVAIKVIERSRFMKMTQARWDEQVKEAETLRKLNHRGIVAFRELIRTPDRLFVVTELLRGGELYDKLIEDGAFPEARARLLMRRIVEAVAYLHDRGVVHRDLKPENILLQSKADDINVKLVDFGVATEQTTSKTFCGSMSYLAPEVLRRRGSLLGQGTYGKGVDMWSVGVICHVVLSLRPPFDEEEEASMHKSICDVLRFAGPEWARVSPAAKDFVSKCLEISEGKRLTAQAALSHPWLADASM